MPLRSRRSKTQKPKYKESDDSESDGDFKDSGSDASIPDADEDSDHSESFDEAIEDDDEPVAKQKTKKFTKSKNSVRPSTSRISMDAIKRSLQSAGLRNDEIQDPSSLEEPKICIKDLTEQEKLLPTFLNLSESDSDPDDAKSKKRLSSYSEPAIDVSPSTSNQAENTAQSSTIKQKVSFKEEKLSDSGTDSEMEDVGDKQLTEGTKQNLPEYAAPITKLNFQHLQEHTKLMDEAKEKIEEYKQKTHNVPKKQDVFNIQELLAMGEDETLKEEEEFTDHQEDSDSDIGDLEEVKEAKPLIPKGGIQLVLNLPTDGDVKKKKPLDIEMMMKRRMNRVKKEYQVYIHRVHVLCWLGHGNYVNSTLNDQNIMAAALSLLPSEQCYPGNRVDIKYVEQVTRWYHGVMNIKEDKNQHKYKPNKRSLTLALLQEINKKTALSKKNLVLIFIAMLRALGIKCRLVMSFRVAPLRPPELLSLSVKNNDDAKKDKKKKPAETSKYFDSSKDNVSPNPKPANKSVKKNTKAQSKSSSKSKIDPNDKISQLDGADDRVTAKKASTASGNQKRKISLNKIPAKQPKLDTQSPNASTSYWDQLMQNVDETPKNPKRVSHRELHMDQSPTYTPPKVKVEAASPLSIFDEATMVVDSTDTLNNSLNKEKTKKKNLGLKKDVNSKSSPDNSVSSSSDNIDKKKKSLSLSSRARNTRSCNVSKENSDKKEEENRTKTRSRQTPKDSVASSSKKIDKETTKPSYNKELTKTGNKKEATKTTNNKETAKTDNKIEAKTNNKEPTKTGNKNEATKTTNNKETAKTDNKKETKTANRKETDNKKEASKSTNNKEMAKTGNKKEATKTSDNKDSTKPDDAEKESVKTTNRRQRTCAVENSPAPKSDSTKAVTRRNMKDKIEKGLNESFKVNSKTGNTSNKGKSKPTVSSKAAEPNSKQTRSKENTAEKSFKGKTVVDKDLSANPLMSPATSSNKMIQNVLEVMKKAVKGVDMSPKRKSQRDGFTKETDEQKNSVNKKLASSVKSRRVSEISDADFQPSRKKAPAPKKGKDRRVLSSDDEEDVNTKRKGVDVWCEVYVEEEEQWISVDVIKAQVHCPNEIYTRSSHPVTYIVGWDNSSNMKDVTRRYVPHWNTTTRKLRTDVAWYEKAMRPWMAPSSLMEVTEDRQLDKMQQDAPLPKSISEYKNHPLYVLKRHLLKYEALYPPDTPTLGFIRNEPVYPRECVYVCHSREMWLKEAKVVRPGEEPYKRVIAKPKYHRQSRTFTKGIHLSPLEIFGPWQVGDYVPPTAENGVVPRNPYGNVELFKACMIPKGTVHLQLPGLNKVAKKLQIDCAPALTGFDFHSGWTHPVYDGFVVCEEFKDQLIKEWEQEQEDAEARAIEKVEKRVYGNWKRLIRGLLIKERLKAKYDFQDVPEATLGGSKAKKRAKGPRFLAKKRRSGERSSDSDSS